MNYIDFAIAVSLFLFFFAAVLMFTTNYFSRYSGLTKTSELRPVAESLFNALLKKKGIPEDWDLNYSISPVKVGLMEDLYMVPVVVKEDGGLNRTDEPVTVRISFDENCQNKSWNATVRLYDEDDNQIDMEISNITNCSNTQFLNITNVTWDVNISANQIKRYYMYFSKDDNVTDPVYSALAYNTSSWIPSDRDEWTENETADFTAWSRYEGSSGTITNDTSSKERGNSSVNITDNFSKTALGMEYNPTANITDVSNGWYIDAWVYIDNKGNMESINISISDSNETITVNISGNMNNAQWYHFEKEISSTSGWANWTAFNASNGINYVIFMAENNTAGLQRTLKIDGLHFKKKPLNVKTFPEEKIGAISYNKFDIMRNLSYEELKKTIGEGYKLSVKIDEEVYGGQVNQSANAVCYENPSVIQYRNGTVKKIIPKLCIWK